VYGIGLLKQKTLALLLLPLYHEQQSNSSGRIRLRHAPEQTGDYDMADMTITINQDVLEQARNTFSAMSQQVEQEIGRQQHLFRRFDDVMNQVRDAVARSQHTASSEQLWHQAGLNEVASNSLDGRHTFEHMRSVATTTSQQLIFAHPGPVGRALASYTNAIDYAFGGVLSEYWNITDGFFPGNTIALSSYSSVIDGNFNQLGSWLNQLNQALEALVRLIDKLLKGESLVIAELTSGGLPSAAQAGGFNAGIASATADPGITGEMVWSYLTSRYELSFGSGFTQEGKKRSLGAGIEVSGDAWDKEISSDASVAGVNIRSSNGVRLAGLTASGGVDVSLDPKADHRVEAGLSGEFTVAELYNDNVLGSKQLGLTDGVSAKALSAEGFVGFKDGSFGAKAGLDLASVEGNVGMNVAGVNVGLDATIGLKAELGVKIGPKTEISLPFVSFGFAFGGAK
jgi:ABC-type multidrug transport system fused ATPase/permease subunit